MRTQITLHFHSSNYLRTCSGGDFSKYDCGLRIRIFPGGACTVGGFVFVLWNSFGMFAGMCYFSIGDLLVMLSMDDYECELKDCELLLAVVLILANNGCDTRGIIRISKRH